MDESRAAKETPGLGKEIKLGLSVVVVLLGVFAFVVYLKFFKGPGQGTPVAAAGASKEKDAAGKPKLASGPASATVVAPAADSNPPAGNAAGTSSRTTKWQGAAPATPTAATTPPAGTSGERYRDRYGNRSGGPPAYSMGAAPATSSSTSPTDPYAYMPSPAATAGNRYALDEPAGGATATAPTQGADVRFAPGAQQNPNQPAAANPASSAAYNPYGRSTGSGRRTAPAVQTAPAEPAPAPNPYSSARSYDMYGRDASGATARPRATTVSTSTAPPPLPRPTAPIDRSTDEYVVQPNDSYWVISQQLYGTGSYFKALYEHNRQRVPHPNDLRPGEVISAPSIDALRQTYPDLCPSAEHAEAAAAPTTLATSGNAHLAAGGRVYVVEEGDTLFDIARFELGRASRWAEIYDLNRQQIGQNIDYLRPGTELLLPPEQESDTSFTRRPEPTTRQR